MTQIVPEDIPDHEIREWFKSNSIDKFKTIREYNIDYNLPSASWDQDLPVILVYCIWSQPLYFKCLYLSILSQIKFTDVGRTKLVIFVAQNLYEEACSIFGGTGILVVPFYEKFFKHVVFSHEIFQNFNGKIVLFDCDTFVYSHDGKYDLYEQISNLPSDGIYMMEDPDPAIKVFYDRKELIPQKTSNEEYAKMWFGIMGKDVETIIPVEPWKLACVSIFDASFFKTNEWSEHVQKCWDIRTGCDETVFLTHAWSNNIPVSHVDDVPGINVRRIDKCIDFIDDASNKDLGILHPLHGSFCHDMGMQKIYDSIIRHHRWGLKLDVNLARSQNMIWSSRSEFFQLDDVLTKVCHNDCSDFFENFDEIKKITSDEHFVDLLEKLSENTYSMRTANHSNMWHQLSSEYMQALMFYKAMEIQVGLSKKEWFHSALHQVGNILIRNNDVVACDLDSLCLIKNNERAFLSELNRMAEKFAQLIDGVAPRIENISDFENFMSSTVKSSHYQSYIFDGKMVVGQHDTMNLKIPFLEHVKFSGKSVLDLGCAQGYSSLYAAKHGATKVLAVDASSQSLEVLRSFNVKQIDAVHDNLSSVLTGKFDICLCLSCLHLLPNPIASLYDVCKCCETLLIEVSLTPDNIIKHKDCVELSATYRFYDSARINWSVGLNSFLYLVSRVFSRVEHLGKNSNERQVYLCQEPFDVV